MRWWNEAARLGDPHACWFIGQRLLEEDATFAAQARGRELIEHSAEHGFPQGCGHLGYLRARELPLDAELLEELAFPLLRLGAIRGDHDAARYLARSLRSLGGPERIGEALYWLHSSSRWDAAAALMLAEYHGIGLGVPPSATTAAAWLALAVIGGDSDAAEILARAFLEERGVPLDPVAAMRLAERAAAAGVGRGAMVLGRIYEDGRGVPQNGRLAAAWYRRGAELGDRVSMYYLARLLFDGWGVEPDPAQAVGWLEKAVDKGGPDVCHLLALMKFRGEGTAPDPQEARRLFLRATSGPHLPSVFTTLEEEAIRFRPAAARPRDLRSQVEELAADPESLPAASALDLGLLLWNGGVGLEYDGALVIELFRAAARKGSPLAAACLSHVLHKAGEDEEGMEWLETAARAGLAGAQRHLAFNLVESGQAALDDPHFLQLLESAADQGDACACVELARLLENAEGPADGRRAGRVEALRRCAREGGCSPEVLVGR